SATAFSHLLLKKGAPASDTDYDFIAQFDSRNNAINLEGSELAATNYGLLVRTPSNSLEHEFVVTVGTNLGGMRSDLLTVSKPQSVTIGGNLNSGEFQYFRFEIPSNSPGWRLVLNSSGASPASLYLRRNELPYTG